MRKPHDIERLYLDFDGFFASVEQQAKPFLRGRPVGVVPFAGAVNTCVIASSKEAKAAGIKGIMTVSEAQRVCPNLVLVAQNPDLYRRAHNALMSEISAVIPIDAIKSIDELTCKLEPRDREDPCALAGAIKKRLHDNIGPYITCSIGFAANRQLAKIAGKMNKPDGVTIWHPRDMPGPLLGLPLGDIPGIGRSMEARLAAAGIIDMQGLLALQPGQMRRLWRNVTGERLCYALHGYDVQASPGQRRMFGHGRVLPPDHRTREQARASSRLLLVKAARRMRRDGFCTSRLSLWLGLMNRQRDRSKRRSRGDSWYGEAFLPVVQDDHACLAALETLWQKVGVQLPAQRLIMRLGVSLLDLSPISARQLDLFCAEDGQSRKWGDLTRVTDYLNGKYGRTIISIGPWQPPPGGYAGGKISYTRIPKAEDFW